MCGGLHLAFLSGFWTSHLNDYHCDKFFVNLSSRSTGSSVLRVRFNAVLLELCTLGTDSTVGILPVNRNGWKRDFLSHTDV
jgi:hypothetical protein